MDIKNMTADEWWDEYDSLPQNNQYEFLKDSLEQGIPPDFAYEIDFIDTMISCFEHLKREKEHDKILEILRLVEENNPELLKSGKFYLDSYETDIHAFKKQEELVRKSMKSLVEDPVDSIDTLIPMVDKLVYYGYNDFVQYICKKVYYEVRDSDKLFFSSEKDFAHIILMMKAQSLYEKFRKGLTADRTDFVNSLRKYGFDDADDLNMVFETIIEDTDLSGLCYEDFNHDKKLFFHMLFLSFGKYALGKNMNFSTANDVWNGAWENFFLDNPMDRKSGRLDYFFKLNRKEFYDYIRDRFGFLSNKKPYAFAVLWGLPYVYDFLHKNALVNQDNYNEAAEFIRHIKRELIEGLKDEVWEYDFVHSWTRPDSINEDEFIKEKEFFERSFYEKTNVSDILPDEYFKTKTLIQREINNRSTVKSDIPKVGRNDPCPCGSGKKYKKCCG